MCKGTHQAQKRASGGNHVHGAQKGPGGRANKSGSFVRMQEVLMNMPSKEALTGVMTLKSTHFVCLSTFASVACVCRDSSIHDHPRLTKHLSCNLLHTANSFPLHNFHIATFVKTLSLHSANLSWILDIPLGVHTSISLLFACAMTGCEPKPRAGTQCHLGLTLPHEQKGSESLCALGGTL